VEFEVVLGVEFEVVLGVEFEVVLGVLFEPSQPDSCDATNSNAKA